MSELFFMYIVCTVPNSKTTDVSRRLNWPIYLSKPYNRIQNVYEANVQGT